VIVEDMLKQVDILILVVLHFDRFYKGIKFLENSLGIIFVIQELQNN
jgi:hypothetical protein